MANVNQLFKRTMKSSTRGTLTQAVRDFATTLTSNDSKSFIQNLNSHLGDILDNNRYGGITMAATLEVSASFSSAVEEITFQCKWGWVADVARRWTEQLELWSTSSADLRIVRDSYDRDHQVSMEVSHNCIFLMRYLTQVCAEEYYTSDLNNDLYSYLVILISVFDVMEELNHENE